MDVERRAFLGVLGATVGSLVLPTNAELLSMSRTKTIVDMAKNRPRTIQQLIDHTWHNGGGRVCVPGVIDLRRPITLRPGVLLEDTVFRAGSWDLPRYELWRGELPSMSRVAGCSVVDGRQHLVRYWTPGDGMEMELDRRKQPWGNDVVTTATPVPDHGAYGRRLPRILGKKQHG